MRAPILSLLLLGLTLAPGTLAAPHAAAAAQPELSVATLLLPTWQGAEAERRRTQLMAVLDDLKPQVVSLQQVQQKGRDNPACWLAQRLRYSCDFITADPPSQPLRLGSALLSRLPVNEDGITLLHPVGRYSAAGMLRVPLGAGQVNIYTARLRPDPDTPQARRHRANDLMRWIAATADGHPSVIAGDFGATAEELVRELPGYQPARRNPSEKMPRMPSPSTPQAVGGHGLDLLFPVKSFSGVRQQVVQLPADGDLPAVRLGMMATLRLQDPAPLATDPAEPDPAP